MKKNLLVTTLLIISVYLAVKHGWDTLNFKNHPESAKTIQELGINSSYLPFIGLFTIATGILILFPKTYFLGNLLSALSIVTILALALQAGNIRMALLEIPFFLMPLFMIWLQYPTWNLVEVFKK